MRRYVKNTLGIMLITIPTIIFTCLIEEIPWWSFTMPVVAVGAIIGKYKWKVSVFAIGFLSGFMVWFGANVFFDGVNNGIILNKIALLLSVNKMIIFILSACIGGLLTALALYTGKNISFGNSVSDGVV